MRPSGSDGEAERVLHEGVGGGAVDVPEVEEPLADSGVHPPGFDVAERGGLGVDQPQPVARRGEAGGLRHPDLVEGAVLEALHGRPRVDARGARDRVEGPQLVDAGHGDDECALEPGEIPGRGEVHVQGGGGAVVHAPLPARAGDGGDGAVGEADAAQEVVHGVGDDEVVTDLRRDLGGEQREPLGLVELRGGAVGAAALAGADHRDDRGAVRGEADEAVAGRVGDEHVAAGQLDRLAGEAECGLGGRGGHVRAALGIEGAAGGVGLHEAADDRVEGLHMTLTGHGGHHVALGVDHDEGRPGAGGVGVPGLQVGVVEHGVLDAVALDRGGERLRVALVLELRGVHADDDERVAVLLLERAQLVEDVQAVDAAEGPEVEHDDLPAEALEIEPLVARVEPAAADELGRAHAGLIARVRLRASTARLRCCTSGARCFRTSGARLCHPASVARRRPAGLARRPILNRPHITTRGRRTVSVGPEVVSYPQDIFEPGVP